MGAAQRMAAESEQRLEQVARRRVATEQRLAELGEETAYLLHLELQTRIAPDKVEVRRPRYLPTEPG
jgi:hypothetical protein